MSFLGGLGKKAVDKAYNLASKVEGGRDYLTTAANTVNSLVKGKDPRVHLKPGNVIQFLSRSSARTIQIVVSNTANELVCDAIGGTGSYYSNAHWLVVVSASGRFYFRNNYNYLAIKNGKIGIIPLTANDRPPTEAEFRVQDVLGSAQAIHLESVHMPGCFISFNEDGQPCEGSRLMSREKYSQLEIILVAYGPGIQPNRDDRPIETSEEASPPSYWEATATSNPDSHSNPTSSNS